MSVGELNRTRLEACDGEEHPFLSSNGLHLRMQHLDLLTLHFSLLMLTFDEYKKIGAKRGKARISYTKKTDDRIDFNMEAETEKGWETQIMGTYRKIGG